MAESGTSPLPRYKRLQRYLNRTDLLVAMLCAALIVWLDDPGRLLVVATAIAYGLLSMLGHTISAVLSLRAKWRAG